MSANPFALTPRKLDLGRVLASLHEKSLNRILAAVRGGGIAVCMGGTGVGKTALLERVAREALRLKITPILIPCGGLVRDESDLTRAILTSLYLDATGSGIQLYYKLREATADGRMAVLLDDITSTPISPRNLGETVRMLADLPNFSVVLAGEPKGLNGILRLCPSLRSRTIALERLGPIDEKGTQEFLQRRADLVGLKISPSVAKILHKAGKGIPREILKLAMRAYDLSSAREIPFEQAVEVVIGKPKTRRRAARKEARKKRKRGRIPLKIGKSTR
jgi:Holliday junction resolvasome RuvABC ATP-dependent DNA helicase subunit